MNYLYFKKFHKYFANLTVLVTSQLAFIFIFFLSFQQTSLSVRRDQLSSHGADFSTPLSQPLKSFNLTSERVRNKPNLKHSKVCHSKSFTPLF